MNLFHIKTGIAPDRDFQKESIPLLESPPKNCGASKAFLVHDSITCIANGSLKSGDCAPVTPGLVKLKVPELV